jgi:murein DD-endopeptidase MepM/ murein hydrolase activator NlpD
MHSFVQFVRKIFTPVTIMLIPHNSRRAIRMRVPYAIVISTLAVSIWSGGYMFRIYQDASMYVHARERLDYYQNHFRDMESTISSLKMANIEFKKLFGLPTKEDVLDNIQTTDSGALDMEVLRMQIEKTIDSVGEIRDYLSLQRDLYRSTPMGWPTKGWMSSNYGRRKHPITGRRDVHTGIDVSARPGTKISVTADGIVSFSGRSGANGNLVAIEHGFGYTTYYAHNKKNLVKVGQVVKRGDVIALMGSTGSSTGPHVHYEIWKEGKNINPSKHLKGGQW